MPAGQVSFRAKLTGKHRLPTAGYPAQMDISQRFSGEGCIAELNFDKPQWCSGDLLVFGADRSSEFQRLTGSAELGFIWKMVHSKRFLILLSRLQLERPR